MHITSRYVLVGLSLALIYCLGASAQLHTGASSKNRPPEKHRRQGR